MPSRLTVVLVSLLLTLPAVIFWLWLVILHARVAILCPEGCRCDIGSYNVRCDDTSLTAVPLIHLTDIRGFWLVRDDINVLVKDSFVSLTELERLFVLNCGLRTIELGAFNGLTKLTELNIWGNEISKILPGTFENLISLVYLNLDGNRIEHVDRDTFRGLLKLKHVDLNRNKLQYLHPDTFLRLPNLQSLSITNTPGLIIPTDRHFIQSHSLSQLRVSFCNVSLVSVKTFANVSSLEWLNLGYNKLRTVDINILKALPKLSTLYLDGNLLHCDCQLQEVWRWFKDHNIRTGYLVGPPKCDSPKEVNGIDWGVLEKGRCFEGKLQYYGDYSNYSDSKSFSYLFRDYYVTINAVPFIIGTIGNLILLIIIIFNKDMHTPPNMYIINLAISDIIYLTVHFSDACTNGMYYMRQRDDTMCIFVPFCRRVSVCLSAYSVALLSIQRYRVTVKPFHVRVSSKPTCRGTVATVFGVWILSALIAVPSLLSRFECIQDSIRHTVYYKSVVIFELLASCVVPLFVIAFTYIMTARHFVESSRSISEGIQNPQLKTSKITAKILVGLTFVFMISYVPYHVLWTYIVWTENKLMPLLRINITHILISNYRVQYLILLCLLLINSCLNPVALFCTSSPFRQHLKRYLTCFCKTNSPSTDLELTRRN